MDQDVAHHFAELRHQLGQLRSALGAGNADQAEQVIGDLVSTIYNVQGEVEALETAAAQLASAVEAVSAEVSSLIKWAVTVNPPFTG
jgi:hypothetical protein